MTPPRLAVSLLRASCSANDWPWVIAELEEEYVAHVLLRNGAKEARRWFWTQAVRFVRALAMKGVRGGERECALLFTLLGQAATAQPHGVVVLRCGGTDSERKMIVGTYVRRILEKRRGGRFA